MAEELRVDFKSQVSGEHSFASPVPRSSSWDLSTSDDDVEINLSGKLDKTDDELDDDQVLIERNGKFLLVCFEELTLAEKEFYTSQKSAEMTTRKKTNSSGETSKLKANDGKKRRNHSAVSRSRSTPEQLNRRERCPSSDIYKLSEEQKRELAAERREKKRKELEEIEKRKKEEEQKMSEANAAFEAWLKKKREDVIKERRKRGEADAQKNSKNEDDKQSSFDEWIKLKNRQRRREETTMSAQRRYLAETCPGHTQEQCDAAFKKWLKKKHKEEKAERQLEERLRHWLRANKYSNP